MNAFKSDREAVAAEALPRGVIVCKSLVTPDAYPMDFTYQRRSVQMIGVAARDIGKGESIRWDVKFNTNDIIRSWPKMDWEGADMGETGPREPFYVPA